MDPVPADKLLQGFLQARWRVDRALPSEEPWQLFFSLFETLNWATALDAAISRAVGGRAKWWKDDEQGYLVSALGYARNRVHHQWAHALRARRRPNGGLPLFEGGFTWIWRDLDELPRENRRSAREDMDAYAYMVRQEPRVVYALHDIESTLRTGVYAARDAHYDTQGLPDGT